MEEKAKKGKSIGEYIFWAVIIGVIALFALMSVAQKSNIDSKKIFSKVSVETDTGEDTADLAVDSGQDTLEAIKRQVIDDAIKQYQIVEKSGNIVDMCVQAGIVKAAYLQANDESGYNSWSNITSKACEAAGMPGM